MKAYVLVRQEYLSLSHSPSARRLIYFSRASSNLFLDTLFLLENI
jgi:hypothetical protein